MMVEKLEEKDKWNQVHEEQVTKSVKNGQLGSTRTCEWDLRGLGEPREGILGEQGGVPEEESDPRPSVNHENGTNEPEERDGLSDGSLTQEHH